MSKNCLMVLVCLGLIFFLGVYFYRIFHHGELANKPIWALMQSFAEKEEYTSHRIIGKEVKPTFVKGAIEYNNKAYDLLGIPTKNVRFPYYWIITNAHVDNDKSLPMRIFIMADGNDFYLSCDYVDDLVLKEKIDVVASNFLKTRCTKY
ncbi:hypothetical protein FZN26_25315 [Escherichia coli]|uniref:hypothetical protein n=1 Tax=Escherichia TaxID=561 RepID=UPI000CF7A2D6|nr:MULTISPECIES: hypothetical protein [Escherichia]NAP37499.1 hypothetical protein [Escherichia coli]NAQ67442.1 hypothetical protein [Escherichia coli]NAQ72499.1 hypothetical protein [Escherichia coli]QHQ00990.1 hypothetical protein FZN31_19630 [Escherichia coli]QMP79958.1 hypothetical protein HVW20_19585 [Escherichia coli]